MSLITATSDKVLNLYCAARALGTYSVHLYKNRESGQANVEYLGLLLILGAALAVSAGFLGIGGDGAKGFLVKFVLNAIKAGLKTALQKLGITVGG